MALYNKMRPRSFSEVKGQDNVVNVLKENIVSGHMPNAMLLIGTRGVGKTTIAKIVAKAVNCTGEEKTAGECCNKCPSCVSINSGTNIDVLELDAASNNGVDNIRSIIERVQYKPQGKMRVIILDEVHMLSAGAFNALLKVLEDGAPNTLFVLCTTEVHKIPATILSRCRKFQFDTISDEQIVSKLEEVCRIYNLTAEKEALALVARAAKGSMRDAESIFEGFLDAEGGNITAELVQSILGYTGDDMIFLILNSILTGDAVSAFNSLQTVIERGCSLSYLLEEMFRILLDIIMVQASGDISSILGNKNYLDEVSSIAFSYSAERLVEIADALREAYERKRGNLELVFQCTILKLLNSQSTVSLLLERVNVLEKEVSLLKSGSIATGQIVPNVEDVAEVPFQVPEEDSTEETQQEEHYEEQTSSANGFVPLTAEQLAELSALGLNVEDTPTETSSTTKENGAAGSAEFADFDGFASFFDGWS